MNVFFANCRYDNWAACKENEMFGTKRIEHPKINPGDLLLIRLTGKPYGVKALWTCVEVLPVEKTTLVPWEDGPYNWIIRCKPIVEFEKLFSEQFRTNRKKSQKIDELYATNFQPSIGKLSSFHARAYLTKIQQEFASELTSNVINGTTTAYDYIQGVIDKLNKLRSLETLAEPRNSSKQQKEIRSKFLYILEHYLAEKNIPIKQRELIFLDLVADFQASLDRNRLHILVSYGIGKGNPANVPWIAFLDKRVTTSSVHGVYCVYLFKADLSGFYLTLNQGIGRTAGKVPTKEQLLALQASAASIRPQIEWLENSGFLLDDLINLADHGATGKAYEKSTIAYKYYDATQIPSDSDLLIDLGNVLKAYEQYVNSNLYEYEDTLASVSESSPQPLRNQLYSLEDFSEETGYSIDQVQKWKALLTRKKQIIIQGPPGTGKTFIAERLAKLMISGTSGSFEVVQFHPAYNYEDFIQGYFPTESNGFITFELRKGRFLDFCDRATVSNNDPYVLIIDEINRANLARVFGELMYLLEYRDKKVSLASNGVPFSIPSNVFIIGTMNTADRSIALVDHALRRRFSFIRIKPEYAILKKHLQKYGIEPNSIISTLQTINLTIDDPNYEIGISYFMRDKDNLALMLPGIWESEIEPYLEEFFYDDLSKIDAFTWSTLSQTTLRAFPK